MLIIPAIDIMNGKCVRLTRGKFNSRKIYSEDPVEVAGQFEKEGAKMLHVIDLDGAKSGIPMNRSIILKIREKVKIPIQVGGGIRDLNNAENYLKAGINKIIIGTRASQTNFIDKLIKKYGAGRIIVAVDFKNGKMALNGWQRILGCNPFSLIEKFKATGVSELIVTDVNKDGTLTEPNYSLYKKLLKTGIRITAAGGVSTEEAISKLRAIGVCKAIIGKAIYERKISIFGVSNGGNLMGSNLMGSNNNPISGENNLTKRIIPCLDVKNNRVVKGVKFQNLIDSGNPVELARKYESEGADELIFLDITASKENRNTFCNIVRKIADNISIPFTVGGGINCVEDISKLLNAGADKISLNTAAVRLPDLISQAAQIYGSQCVVVAIDFKKTREGYKVFIKGGSEKTNLEPAAWAKKVESLGAGEILLTSMDSDGTKKGFDLNMLEKITSSVNIPVIASGGAGCLNDFKMAILEGNADAVLAASLFHFGTFSIRQVKKYLKSFNIKVRL